MSTITAIANITEELQSKLVIAAQEAQKKAYAPYSLAPYSLYFVGASLLTDHFEIFQGCNVENASYGLCNCAERSAIFSALSQGKKDFQAMAVVTHDGGSPCGVCRQVLNEFNPKLTIIMAKQNGEIVTITTLDKLLPEAFGPKNLE